MKNTAESTHTDQAGDHVHAGHESRLRQAKSVSKSWRRRESFTLIELLVTIAIAGIILLSLALALRENMKTLSNQKDMQSATMLADDLMGEIRAKSFADPQSPTSFGLEESYPRRNFDDADDYNGWTSSPPQTIEGTIMTNYAGFWYRVAVSNVLESNFNALQPPGSTSYKRILVVVSNSQVVVSNVSVVSEYD
jgi:prepilin-type N-terminal cleavage/methylation domain-containing protein